MAAHPPVDLRVETKVRATAEAVWAAWSDVPGWATWNPAVKSARVVSGPSFGVGTRARLRQPALPLSVWRVTACDPPTSFTWARPRWLQPAMVAEHHLTTRGDELTVTLRLTMTGPLAFIFRRPLTRIGEQFVQREAEGLRRHVEGTAGTAR